MVTPSIVWIIACGIGWLGQWCAARKYLQEIVSCFDEQGETANARAAMIKDTDWRLIEALHDIQEALSALTFFMDVPEAISEVQQRRFRCYHDMMAVSYWRPFSDSNGLPKLSFKKIGLKPLSDEKALHKRLGEYRNKLVAHTDADRMRVVVKAKKTGLDGDGFQLWPAIDRDRGFEFLNDQEQLEGWLRKIQHHLTEKVFDLVQNLPPEVLFERDYLKDT